MRWAETEVANAGIVPAARRHRIRRVEQRDGISRGPGSQHALRHTCRVEANRFGRRLRRCRSCPKLRRAGSCANREKAGARCTVMAILEEIPVDSRPAARDYGAFAEHSHDLIGAGTATNSASCAHCQVPVFARAGHAQAAAQPDPCRNADGKLSGLGIASPGSKAGARSTPCRRLSSSAETAGGGIREAKVAVYGNAGIRQTRTIVGQSHVTVEDVATGGRPPDAIARTISGPSSCTFDMAGAHWTLFDDDHIHYIPFGAMLAQGAAQCRGIYAGRCIDAEPAALASLRVMRPCFAMGLGPRQRRRINGYAQVWLRSTRSTLPALQDARG